MKSYDTKSEYFSRDSVLNASPVWAIGVVRFKYPATFDRRYGAAIGVPSDAVLEREPLIITSDATSLSISTARPYRSSLSANLLPGQMDYLSNIMPGDWVFAWVRNDGEQGLSTLIDKLRDPEKDAPNGFMDGLKFVGRVVTLRMRVQVSAQGQKQRTYALSAAGFTEFDGVFIRDPNMVATESMPQQLLEFGINLDTMTTGANELNQEGSVNGNQAIPVLADAFFGKGAFSARNKRASVEGIQVTPNRAYLIPSTAARWLGVSNGKSFADILNMLVGRQTYSGQSGYRYFIPDLKQDDGRVYRTRYDMFSSTLPQAPSDGTIWQLLNSYLNSPLNEMFATLRVNTQGRVMPTLVARQTPYSTPEQSRGRNDFDVTGAPQSPAPGQSVQAKGKPPPAPQQAAPQQAQSGWLSSIAAPSFSMFPASAFAKAPAKWQPANPVSKPAPKPLQSSPPESYKASVATVHDLPRWEIDDGMVFSADLGRNDQSRFNFVYVTPGANMAIPIKPHEFLVVCPPVYDELDIARSGVRRFAPNLNTSFREGEKGTKEWRDILVDTAMGQHLRLNGTITLIGIQAPIAVGDSAEYDGAVFIIENISHGCSVSPQGQKQFTTTLSLSMGLSTNEAATGSTLGGELSIYPQMEPQVNLEVTAESIFTAKVPIPQLKSAENPEGV